MPYTLTRSLLVVILPGLLALLPWAIWLATQVSEVKQLYKDYALLANALLVGVAILFGSVIEGMLSYLEVRWDEERDEKYEVRKYWFDYLALQPKNEPVGMRYIGRKVTTMYFELEMMVAAPCALIGIAGLFSDIMYKFWSGTCLVLGMLAVASIVFFYFTAKRTHLVLCETRKEIVVRSPPATN